MSIRTILLVSMLAFSTPLMSGCAAVVLGGAAAAGYGTAKYLTGELQITEGISLNRAWGAAKLTMKDMEFTIIEKDKDAIRAKVIALGVGGKKIRIHMERKSDNVTLVKIRVGTFGNERDSQLILEKMRNRY